MVEADKGTQPCLKSSAEVGFATEAQELQNEQAFEALLKRMRDVSHNERDKGDLFERLMCKVLAIASPYCNRFSKVQFYKGRVLKIANFVKIS